ncbi:MAG TPA: DUF4249 domain-containing protein [Lunatimonas sp.]|nr:DUF4249 domain-containing protein [Lunatimonas sp.]
MKYITQLLFLMTVTSCNFFDKEINLEIPEHTPRIVVNAIVEAGGEELRLAITRSLGMRDTSSFSEPLPNPEILAIVNGQSFIDFQLDTANHYVIPATIQTGDRIELEVRAPNMETVFSETVVPVAPHIRNVKLGGTVYDFGGWEKREISFVIQDIPSQENFYSVKFIQEREDFPNYFGSLGIGIDSPITWLNYVYSGLAFTDAVFRDGEATITIWVDEYHISRISDQTSNFLLVETLEKANYDYRTTFYTHYNNQQPGLFGGEPAPMVNNVRGGFGLFSSSAGVKIPLERE